jgi:hypothetical protein
MEKPNPIAAQKKRIEQYMQPFRAHLLEQKLLEIIQDAYAQGWKDR